MESHATGGQGYVDLLWRSPRIRLARISVEDVGQQRSGNAARYGPRKKGRNAGERESQDHLRQGVGRGHVCASWIWELRQIIQVESWSHVLVVSRSGIGVSREGGEARRRGS